MAFKSIGTLACDVLKKAEAARADNAAREFGRSQHRVERKVGSGATDSGEARPSHLLTEGRPASNGKKRGEANPASLTQDRQKAESERYPSPNWPPIMLVVSRDGCAAPPQGRVPRPAVHLSLVTMDGVHAAPRMASSQATMRGTSSGVLSIR